MATPMAAGIAIIANPTPLIAAIAPAAAVDIPVCAAVNRAVALAAAPAAPACTAIAACWAVICTVSNRTADAARGIIRAPRAVYCPIKVGPIIDNDTAPAAAKLAAVPSPTNANAAACNGFGALAARSTTDFKAPKSVFSIGIAASAALIFRRSRLAWKDFEDSLTP